MFRNMLSTEKDTEKAAFYGLHTGIPRNRERRETESISLHDIKKE